MDFENLKKNQIVIDKLKLHFGFDILSELETWAQNNQEYFDIELENIGLKEPKPTKKTKQIQETETVAIIESEKTEILN